MFKYNTLILVILFLLSSSVYGQTQPVETGDVKWMRSLKQAVQASKTNDKPVLILFQEIPGCSTCRNYGQKVLTHPLIVEAIESLFVPLCIHNNKGGEDQKVLKSFGEPAWNNPVVRITDSKLRDLTERIAGQYSKAALVHGMVLALQKYGNPVPKYLQLLDEELQARKNGVETTYFSMYCFWSGEKELGKLKGVYSTTAGFMDGKEVVRVVYAPLEISYFSLLQAAKEVQCGDEAYTDNRSERRIAQSLLGEKRVFNTKSFKIDKTPKYYLSKTPFKYVQMTALQACRANSLIAQGQSCKAIFSPRQLDEYNRFSTGKKVRGTNYIERYF